MYGFVQMNCAKCGIDFEYNEDRGIDLCRKCYIKLIK